MRRGSFGAVGSYVVTFGTSLVGLLVLGAPAGAQSVTKDAPARTTRSGVYSAAQATRGKEVYLTLCKSCHAPATHSGVTFENLWQGHPLSELYEYVATKMPKNDPGGLSPEQTADVIAYLLRMNAMPVGRAELPPDQDALGTIRIDVKPPRPAAKAAATPAPRVAPTPAAKRPL